jgi:hypothetical protein
MYPLLPLLLIAAPGPRVTLPRGPSPLRKPPPPLSTSIALTIKTATGETRDNTPAAGAVAAARPVAVLKSGEKPQIRWSIRNTDPKKPIPDVVLHFLVTREQSANEPIPVDPRKGTLMDQVMGTTLAPKGATTGNYNTAIYEPGIYLVQVEILDDSGQRRQSCALDLKVE